MAFETLYYFQQLELDADTSGALTLDLYTDLPGQAMAVRHSETVNTETTTTGRRTVNIRLPGTTQGKQYKLRLSGNAVGRIFGARIFARPVGLAGAGGWAWYDVPLEGTAEIYGRVALPIESSEEFYGRQALPIEGTEEFYHRAAFPLRTKADLPRWFDLDPDIPA